MSDEPKWTFSLTLENKGVVTTQTYNTLTMPDHRIVTLIQILNSIGVKRV